MKKLLVLAMVLVLAAPMFAEMSIGGEFDYYLVNGFEKEGAGDAAHFERNWDKGEIDFKASVGDYSQVRIELEEDGAWNRQDRTGGNRMYTVRTAEEGSPSFNYFRVITDWGKFFGLDGIGIKTDIGLNSWETFDNVEFTGFEYEYADHWEQPFMTKDFGAKISLSFVDGLVQPYFAWVFDTITVEDGARGAGNDKTAEWLVGSGFDFNAMGLPLWLEAYYYDKAPEDNKLFGVEAMYTLAIGDMSFLIGGYLNADNNGDDWGEIWGFGVAFEAFGAHIGISAGGVFGEDYCDAAFGADSYSAFSVLGVDASYDILDWLAVNAGASFAFGDYKENQAGDKAFQTFEAGVIVKPDKGVKYKLGYLYVDEDVAAAGGYFFRTLNTKGATAEKGGLYFVTQIDF